MKHKLLMALLLICALVLSGCGKLVPNKSASTRTGSIKISINIPD
jgi:uncharacterized protein YceK